MPLDIYAIQALHGLVYGMLLFLVASGLTLGFGMMDVLNLAHASFYMLGAYLAYSIATATGSFWLALLLCPILIGALGAVVERFLARRAYHGGHITELLLTFGLFFIFGEATRLIWGGSPLSVAAPRQFAGDLPLGGIPYPVYRLFILGFSLLVLLGMAALLRRTRIGIIVRAAEVLVFALFGVGFNLVFGYAGLLPFGHAALFGVGGYATALLVIHGPGVSLLVVLPLAAVIAAAAAVVIGVFCVRLTGAYFAMTSLAFQMFLFAVALKWRTVTGGDDGMGVVRPDLTLPLVGAIPLKSEGAFYYFALIVVGVAIAACYALLQTLLGNSVVCVREKEGRAAFPGYNIFRIKLTIFATSGLVVGLAGGLFVLFEEFVATTSIDNNMSMVPVLMTVIGGASYFFGPVVGATFYLVFQDWLSSVTSIRRVHRAVPGLIPCENWRASGSEEAGLLRAVDAERCWRLSRRRSLPIGPLIEHTSTTE